jgi:hypothetical protein
MFLSFSGKLYSISTVVDDKNNTFAESEWPLGDPYLTKKGKPCHCSGGYLSVFAALAEVQ